MPTYLIRLNRKTIRGTVEPRFMTIDSEGLQVTHPDVNRTVGRMSIGRVVEKVGKNTSAFYFRPKRDTKVRARDAGGADITLTVNGGSPVHSTKLNQHIRHLGARDLTTLAAFDERIEELQAAVRDVRTARRKAVEDMWDGADRVTRTEFDEMVG